jgi:hypothetical protein
VLAAAIRAAAGVIVTFNLKDFPAAELARYGIEARYPDDFLASLCEAFPGAMNAAFRRQREGLTNPPLTAQELLAILENQGLKRTVARIRPMADLP